jgi:hypothetical protein
MFWVLFFLSVACRIKKKTAIEWRSGSWHDDGRTRIHLYATGADSWGVQATREREIRCVLYNRQVFVEKKNKNGEVGNRENGIYF